MVIKKYFVVTIFVGALFLGGCSLVAKPADVTTESPVQVITGKVVKSGENFSITADGKIVEMVSRKIDLGQYDGRVVTVTGEYSGTTLYVDTVK